MISKSFVFRLRQCTSFASLDLHSLTPACSSPCSPCRPQVQRASHLHDHVADLRRGAPAEPGLPSSGISPPPTLSSPPDAEDGVELLGGAQLELGLDRHLTSLADADRDPQAARRGAPRGRDRSSRGGCAPRRRRQSSRPHRRATHADAARVHASPLQPALPPHAWTASSRRATSSGPALGSGGPPVLAEDLVVRVHDDGLDLWFRRDRSPRGACSEPGLGATQTITTRL